MSDNINIYRQASNIGNIKGSPKGSGHGGYVKAPVLHTKSIDDLRGLMSQGKIVHLKVNDSDNYIANSFLGADKIEGKFICPLKINSNEKKENLKDIVSTIDTFGINDFEIQNVFDNEKEALNYFIKFNESFSKFDTLINQFAKVYNN